MDKHVPRPTSKKRLSLLMMAVLMFAGLSGSTMVLSQGPDEGPVATMVITAKRIEWQPQVKYDSLILTIAGPGDLLYGQEFPDGQTPVFEAGAYPDGTYTYELRVVPLLDEQTRAAMKAARETGQPGPVVPEQVQSGHFGIQGGTFVEPAEEPGGGPPGPPKEDQLILDDLIVTGSACVGFDCFNGESFGFDTLRLKENNLRIRFYDTSTSASFPSNDWQITANDSSNGGANKFSIDDIDSGKTPFTIEAGTRANALYVDDSGRVGLGTSTPAEDLHIWYGDTPTIRLHQSGSGWAPQTWDLAGNEANFFIRDVTNGSKLPLRIKPGAPTNSVFVNNNGDVGVGTQSPGYSLEVERSGSTSSLVMERSDVGVKMSILATGSRGMIGSLTNHDVFFIANMASLLKLLSTPEATTGAQVVVPATQHVNGDLYVDGTIYGTVGAKADSAAIEELRAEVAALEVQVGALEADNAALRGQVDDLEKRMATLEAKIGGDLAPKPKPSGSLPGAGLLLAGLVLPVGAVWMIQRDRNR